MTPMLPPKPPPPRTRRICKGKKKDDEKKYVKCGVDSQCSTKGGRDSQTHSPVGQNVSGLTLSLSEMSRQVEDVSCCVLCAVCVCALQQRQASPSDNAEIIGKQKYKTSRPLTHSLTHSANTTNNTYTLSTCPDVGSDVCAITLLLASSLPTLLGSITHRRAELFRFSHSTFVQFTD